MYETRDNRTGAVSEQPHPLVYRAITGLVMCLGRAIVGIVATGPAGLALSLLSLFGFATIALGLLVWPRRAGSGAAPPNPARSASFAEWLSGEFDTWEARLRAGDATVQILVPIAAVTLGMRAFALAWHLAV